jgi:hypothetical protein
MAMSISAGYIEPGIFIVEDDVAAPNPTGGNFTPIFVGLGRKEYDVSASMTRGSTSLDLITKAYNVIDILSIVDTLGNKYNKGTDFTLSVAGPNAPAYVNWAVPVTLTSSVIAASYAENGKSISINIDGNTQSINFTGTNPIAIANIIIAINNAFTPTIVATNVGGAITLTGKYLINITGGNATDDLGFPMGTKVQSSQPLVNTGYTIVYKRLKLLSEYGAKIFSRLSDVYAEYGPYAYPNVVDIGNGGTLTTGQAVSDTTFTDTNANFLNVSIGDYVKIMTGAGSGQVRVITSIDITGKIITIGDSWNDILDTTSTYTIFDGPISEISIACTIAQKHGAVNFMGSQTYDDIVDDNNVRLAIDNTKELVQGQQGWCLVYLKGVSLGDSIVSYIEQYLSVVNTPTNKQERMALLGIAATTNYLDVVNLATGINNERIGLIATPSATITGIGVLDGSYIAAAIAGIVCNPSYDPGEPITGKAVLFDFVNDPWLRYEKRQMGGAGSIIVEQEGASYNILHYLSTYPSDIIKSELKVIRQEDDLKKTIRGTLQPAISNVRIVNDGQNLISIAASFMNLILQTKKNLGAINNFSNLQLSINSNEPRELDISYRFYPTFDMNWCVVTQSASISQ